jgi:hypothetical protein
MYWIICLIIIVIVSICELYSKFNALFAAYKSIKSDLAKIKTSLSMDNSRTSKAYSNIQDDINHFNYVQRMAMLIRRYAINGEKDKLVHLAKIFDEHLAKH